MDSGKEGIDKEIKTKLFQLESMNHFLTERDDAITYQEKINKGPWNQLWVWETAQWWMAGPFRWQGQNEEAVTSLGGPGRSFQEQPVGKEAEG